MGANTAQDDSSLDDGEYDPRQLDIDRNRNDQRLKSRFEHIFSKYEHDFEGVGDEIDISTGKIVVNNGHLQHMEHEADPGKSASSLFAQAFQEELEHEEEDDDVGGGADDDTPYRAGYLDEPLHSSGIEEMPTVTSRPPNIAADLGSGSIEKPIPRLARLIASGSTPQRAGTQQEGEQVPEAPSSAITVSGLTTPLLARFPGFYQSVRDAQPDTGRISVAPEAVKALGVSIANQLAQYMPGSGQRKKKAREPRLSLPVGVTDPTWAYPELPASVTQKRQRPSSPIGTKVGSSPVPDTVGQESLWTAEGVVRPRKRRRTQAEIANGVPSSAMPLAIRPSSSGKGKQNTELRRCWNCSLTRTPSWQQGPHGQDLCMSCGRYFERYRRMKPFDSPTPEPEERPSRQAELDSNNASDHEPEVEQFTYESEEPSCDIQSSHHEGNAASSPPALRDNIEGIARLQVHVYADTERAENETSPILDGETERATTFTQHRGPEISAATHDKPIAFVMLPKQTAEVLSESATSWPEQTCTGIMEEEANFEMHAAPVADSMDDNVNGFEVRPTDTTDDYVNDFETTPAGQLERQLNPLLHHGPLSSHDEPTALPDHMSPMNKTPRFESSTPSTSTSSGRDEPERHHDETSHHVTKASLWKNSAWNNSQDELLLELREEQDLEWEDISGFLPGHSPEAVERRYELLIDAAAHTMRVSSQTSALQIASLPQSTSPLTKNTCTEDDTVMLAGKPQMSQTPKTLHMPPKVHEASGAPTSRRHVVSSTPVASESAPTPQTLASVQNFSSPADDYSPLPGYPFGSEEPADATAHETPRPDTTENWARPGATPSTGGRKADFALIDDVFDNAGLADPSQQLFREMGSSPSPAPAFEDSGLAIEVVDTPLPVEESNIELEVLTPVDPAATSNTPRQAATRSPYRTRKRLSDQSARDSVVDADNLSLCSQPPEPSRSKPANSDQRPRLSYAQLVEAAFIAHDRRPMRSVDVFTWVETKYPWFRKLKDSPLKARIRATLSAKPQFVRVDMPDGTKAWRNLKKLDPINAKIRSRRKSRRITIGTDFEDNDPMDVSQLIEEEDELATPKTTSLRKSLLRKFVSPRMSTPVPIFVQSTKKMDKRRSSGRVFDMETGTPVREVDPDLDELAVFASRYTVTSRALNCSNHVDPGAHKDQDPMYDAQAVLYLPARCYTAVPPLLSSPITWNAERLTMGMVTTATFESVTVKRQPPTPERAAGALSHEVDEGYHSHPYHTRSSAINFKQGPETPTRAWRSSSDEVETVKKEQSDGIDQLSIISSKKRKPPIEPHEFDDIRCSPQKFLKQLHDVPARFPQFRS